MKKNYFRILLMAVTAFTANASAQCSVCTITISSADASNYILTSGQKLCITPTGIASGLITVQASATLCNEGTLNSSNIWVNGGNLNNYGTMNNNNVLVDAQGDFSNYMTANIDSLLVTESLTTLNNYGTMTHQRIGIADGAMTINNGMITTDYWGDSIGQVTNNASGNVKINFDFLSGYSSMFTNNGFVDIDRDFYNSTSSTFQTSCMVSVGRDWYNSAIIYGPGGPACGGFNIAGGSYNSGTIGSMAQNVDICDAGNPPFGLDGPGGTIAGTTTYCACANACIYTGISEQAVSSIQIGKLYPNPASDILTVELTARESGKIAVEVMDMMGRKQQVKDHSVVTGSAVTIDVSKMAPGTYILVITDSEKLQTKQLFSVSR